MRARGSRRVADRCRSAGSLTHGKSTYNYLLFSDLLVATKRTDDGSDSGAASSTVTTTAPDLKVVSMTPLPAPVVLSDDAPASQSGGAKHAFAVALGGGAKTLVFSTSSLARKKAWLAAWAELEEGAAAAAAADNDDEAAG